MLPDPITIENALEALKVTLTIIADKAKPKVKEQILKWKTTQQAEKLQSNIRQIGRITTIAREGLHNARRSVS